MMKRKIFNVFALLLLVLATPVVFAATPNEELLSYAENKTANVAGETFKATLTNINSLKRYLNNHTLTANQVSTIKSKVDSIVKDLESAGTIDTKKMSKATIDSIKSKLTDIANVVNLTVKFGNGTATFYENGERINSISLTGVLVNTSTNSYNYVLYAVVIALAVVAVAFALKTKNSN